jgi:hypothetical protein
MAPRALRAEAILIDNQPFRRLVLAAIQPTPNLRRRLGISIGHAVESEGAQTPSRSQSGEHDYHGSITKTGSQLARRLLVEAAWHYGREPRVGATLANRQEGQPDHILQISNRCQHRLHHLYTSMRARGKHQNVTTVAVARELSCFLWAAATAP